MEKTIEKMVNDALAAITPKVETHVVSNPNGLSLIYKLNLPEGHRELDSASYLERRFKKLVPALEEITVLSRETGQSISIVMRIPSEFDSVNDINTLNEMASSLMYIVKNRLEENSIVSNIGEDCKPWFADKKESASNPAIEPFDWGNDETDAM